MSENYQPDVKLDENPDGTVSFATEVVATIAGLAATEVEGVASMSSQSSTWLPSITIIRSPRRIPWLRSQLATCDERRDRSAKLRRVAVPSCSTITRAGLSALAGSAATWSNQSKPKLNSVNSGQVNSSRACW